ncbi:MAG: AAA family ATPase [Lachnospiraceae bacterium]|jgi:DNA-binding SARP family transcriptional activator
MERIEVTLLGSPSVEYQGKSVLFPYKKAEGLFYYLCVKKRMTRNEAIEIFWSDCDAATAKKNMRNAIYNIRKVFGTDILLVEGTSVVKLNPERNISIDMDHLSDEVIADHEFLHFFYIKDCYEFEQWVEDVRGELKDRYIRVLRRQIAQCRDKKDSKFLEKSGLRLLKEQVWEESLHRDLMSKMAELGDYQAAISQYQHLSRDLESNLGVALENETEELYQRICDMKSQVTSAAEEVEEHFYGRESTLYHIFSRVNGNRESGDAAQAISFVITGEAGVGKSMLMKRLQKMMRESGHLVFTWICWETDMYLRSWYGLMDKVKAYCKQYNIEIEGMSQEVFGKEIHNEKSPVFLTKLQLAIESVFRQLQKVFPDKKIVLFIDDLQWMDDTSLHLLGNIVFRMESSNFSVISAYRGVCWKQYIEKLSNYQIPLIVKGLLEIMELPSFTEGETREIICQELREDISETDLQEVYANTGGNAYFLKEMVKQYNKSGRWETDTPEINNIINSRLMHLNEAEKTVLDVLSMFSDRASIEEIVSVLPGSELKIAESIDSLLVRKIITEELEDDKMYLKFSHRLIKSYMYKNLSESKKYLLRARMNEKKA